MEGMDMEDLEYNSLTEEIDVCARILRLYDGAASEHNLNVCTSIGVMSQELKEDKKSLKPLTYFFTACSSLQRFLLETEVSGHHVDALITILSEVIEFIDKVILRKVFDQMSDILRRVFQLNSVSQDGIIPGLKCVSDVLVENLSWADVSPLFDILIRYVSDDRTKVRKQAHSRLLHVFQSYERSPKHTRLIGPASEAVTKLFERSLLLEGGTSSNGVEEPKGGAQEVLYILDALRVCLPYMSEKSSTKILKYFKRLLDLRQPLVTRRITDCLNAFCLASSRGGSPEAILDLLCSLATSVANESNADNMTFTARLLGVGIKRVYGLNRQICVVKLPMVFNALSDILASDHEEALLAAVQAYKSLIDGCIDEDLIRQGVDQITSNASVDTRKSMPTVIEKVCATVGSLVDYSFSTVWDMAFQVISALFDKLGQDSSYFLRETLQSLADMQNLPEEDFQFRRQLHACVGSALGAMGPETFLSILPLELNTEVLSEANVWLFPILKQYTVGARLRFFTVSILGMIKDMKQKAALLVQEGKVHSARTVDNNVYALWSLLPSFCNHPRDTAESFKDLGKALCPAIVSEDSVRGIICSSVQTLVQQNRRVLEGKENISDEHDYSIAEKRAIAYYTAQVAADNLSAIRSSASELLSVLLNVFSESSKDTVVFVQGSIAELASVAEAGVVSRLFRKIMQNFLMETKQPGDATKSRSSMQLDGESSRPSARAHLIDMAVSFLPGLDTKEIDLLLLAIKPGLEDIEVSFQKKAYKVLSVILRDSEEFISRNLQGLLTLMIEVLPSCHFSAKRHRLDCLYFLIIHLSKDISENSGRGIIMSFLTEIVLALKEANKKTRNRAYEILVQIGHIFGDEEKGGQKEDLLSLFNIVAGGLAGETPQMISASIKGLARLAYEFSDLISSTYSLLPSTFLLLQRKNREIIKASLGLLKVLVAKSKAESLQIHLKDLVEGLLNWPDSSKNHFKAKVKVLFEMLVKQCGMEAVKEVMPEEHKKLLTNIRKIKERKERKLGSDSGETRSHLSKATTSRHSKWNHSKIFSDFGDEESENSDNDYMDAKTITGGRMKTTAMSKSRASSKRETKRLQGDFDQADDEPLDLLDRQKTRSALRSSKNLKRKAESDDELEIDSEGRLVIQEGDKKAKKEFSDPDFDVKSRAESRSSRKSQDTKKRRKTSESGWAYTGKEYASKKAGGDLKRKDKLEPYAYWPLDRKMLSRRPEQKASARRGMASVVKLAKNLEGKSVAHALSINGQKFKGKNKANQKRR